MAAVVATVAAAVVLDGQLDHGHGKEGSVHEMLRIREIWISPKPICAVRRRFPSTYTLYHYRKPAKYEGQP